MDDWVMWTCRCGEKHQMTAELDRLLRRTSQQFYCVHGHPCHWPQGESSEGKLRRERDRLKQQLAQKDDEIRDWRATANDQRDRADRERRRANGYKGHATRITKRAKAGVCPCCNRSFDNLRRHMETKHPTFTPQPLEVIDGGKAVA